MVSMLRPIHLSLNPVHLLLWFVLRFSSCFNYKMTPIHSSPKAGKWGAASSQWLPQSPEVAQHRGHIPTSHRTPAWPAPSAVFVLGQLSTFQTMLGGVRPLVWILMNPHWQVLELPAWW